MKRVPWASLLLCCLLAVSLSGCSLMDKLTGKDNAEESAADTGEPEEEHDPEYPVEAGGVRLLSRPGSVVSLAPALTEKLFDLAMEDRLTGISDYCDFPSSVTGRPPCGTAQIPDVEVILAIEPHLVITEAELPEDAATRLEEAGIPVAVFPHAGSVDQLCDTYTDLARLLEGQTVGGLIGATVADEFRDGLRALENALAGQESKSILYLRLLDFTVATGDTFEQELFDSMGVRNIAAAYADWSYPREAAESTEGKEAFAALDAIFMDESFVSIKDLERSDFYKGLPSILQDRYLYISSILLERQSLRTLDELYRMAGYVYPDVSLPSIYDSSDHDDGYQDGDDGAYDFDDEAADDDAAGE